MKFEKSESRKMKYRVLLWLRLEQRCAFIATEVGAAFSADCLGVNEKKMIEVEIKTTFEDFKNDFQKHKHRVFSRMGEDYYTQWIPTHFYFAVPESLVEKVQEYLNSNVQYSNYGVINSDEMKVVRRAKWIHKREPNSKVKFQVALRMGSELIRFHEAML